VVKGDRQLNESLNLAADMLERHVSAERVPRVFERLVGVEKVGAVELADAAVQMLVDGRRGHNGC
jgi:hypothetical protein